MGTQKRHSSELIFIVNTALVLASLVGLVGCGSNSMNNSGGGTEDSSASGTVAAAAGGALSGSSSGGTQAFSTKRPDTYLATLWRSIRFLPDAMAATLCPTFRTSNTGCIASGGTMWLSYNTCNFGVSAATWDGTQAITLSSGTASCGSFPNPGASGSLIRQFVTGATSTTPGSTTITTVFGTTRTIDHATSNLGNFNSDPISTSTYVNNGYGTKVTLNSSGLRTTLDIAEHVTGVTGNTTLFDHSINGALTISETAEASSETISGTITVYHNLLKVVGTSTFTSVTHSDTCCFPISGTITTSFAAATTSNGGTGAAPAAAGSKFVGKTETLTLTGCGTATFVDINGTSASVTLSHCS